MPVAMCNARTARSAIRFNMINSDTGNRIKERQRGKYDPADLEDRYENRLRAMIDAKLASMPLESEPAHERGNVIDLVADLAAALKSLAVRATEANTEKKPNGTRPKKTDSADGQRNPEARLIDVQVNH
jgi:DNA end-binding protein Ku